jgi:hypothetical protein
MMTKQHLTEEQKKEIRFKETLRKAKYRKEKKEKKEKQAVPSDADRIVDKLEKVKRKQNKKDEESRSRKCS